MLRKRQLQGGLDNMPLGPLGIGNMTESSANSTGINPALQEFLDNVKKLDSTASKAVLLQEQATQLAQTKPEGFLDKLLSKEGLLKMGLAGGAVALGAPALGAGAALGTLNAADIAAGEAKVAHQKAIEDNQAATDTALQRVDNQQQKMVSLFTSNPEAFAEVDPLTMGTLLTGLEVPVDPVARLNNRRQDVRWKADWDLTIDQLGESTTTQHRAGLVRGLEALRGELFPPDVRAAMTSSLQDKDYLEAVNKEILKMALNEKTGQTGLVALNNAFKDGRGEQLWTILPEITWVEDSGTFSTTREEWKLIERMNTWWADSSVPTEEKLATGGDPTKIADAVFSDEPGFKGVMEKKLTNSDISLGDVWRITQGTSSQLREMKELFDLGDFSGATPEEQNRILQGNVNSQITQVQETLETASVSANEELVRSGASRLAMGTSDTFTAGVYIRMATQAMQNAMANATREDGTVDPAKFEDEFDTQLGIAMQALVKRANSGQE